MEMEKIKITNPSQFEKLVEELEKNPPLARGFRKGTTPSNFKEQWESIATVLNSLGPPSRTGDGWQKIWRDLKFKVKRKMAINKAEGKATGGGVFKQIPLGPLEEAVANLLQFEKQINPEGMVQGIPNTEDNENCYFLECVEMDGSPTTSNKVDEPSTSQQSVPSSSKAPPALVTSTASTPLKSSKQTPLKKVTPSTSKKTESLNKNELLKKHSTDQRRRLREISNSITSVKRTLRDVKDIEAKRLQIEIDRSKREEEVHQVNIKIKTIELCIKQKELELLTGTKENNETNTE